MMSEENQVEGEELPHLLLVDDDATFTRVMARAMSRRGFRVSTASSAEEGLILAQQDLPDYATLDLKMEGDSGLVLLPKLLELDPEMRVVILTGYSSIATAVEAVKRGACNYLCKPADADDVLAALLSEHTDLDSLVTGKPDVGRPPAVGAYPARTERARGQYLGHRAGAGHAPADLAAQTAEAPGSALIQYWQCRPLRG
ncbi:two component Fis family transcriptional regulator [Pseudomonas putida S11]|nr:two component Fis family transcriptional regulator [Pseudomonas putida S11]